MPVSTNSTKKASSSSRSRMKQAELDVAKFANNSHQTEYTLMMHKYADLDKRERSLKIKQRVANWMLFASVILTIGCIIGTAFICTTIQSIKF